MLLAETIDHLYLRFGRYLGPDVDTDVINNDHRVLAIRSGLCERTGIEGQVVDYVERQDGDRVTIPTLARLLWLFGKHSIGDKDGVFKSSRIGKGRVIALTHDQVLATHAFAKPIPDLIVQPVIDIIRSVAGRDCLFLAFTDKPTAVLGNGLRWSVGDEIEVNGRFGLARDRSIENGAVNVTRAIALAGLMREIAEKTSRSDVSLIRRLLLLPERSQMQQQQLLDLTERANLPEAWPALFTADENEIILAYRLWEK